MSLSKHDDECPGCRPALYDTKQRKPLGQETPEMQAVNAVWKETTRQERDAFHDVTCLNSRLPSDLRLVQPILEKISQALHELVKKQVPYQKDPYQKGGGS